MTRVHAQVSDSFICTWKWLDAIDVDGGLVFQWISFPVFPLSFNLCVFVSGLCSASKLQFMQRRTEHRGVICQAVNH